MSLIKSSGSLSRNILEEAGMHIVSKQASQQVPLSIPAK